MRRDVKFSYEDDGDDGAGPICHNGDNRYGIGKLRYNAVVATASQRWVPLSCERLAESNDYYARNDASCYRRNNDEPKRVVVSSLGCESDQEYCNGCFYQYRKGSLGQLEKEDKLEGERFLRSIEFRVGTTKAIISRYNSKTTSCNECQLLYRIRPS